MQNDDFPLLTNDITCFVMSSFKLPLSLTPYSVWNVRLTSSRVIFIELCHRVRVKFPKS